ncbi:MAG: DUF2254 domain-containing protein [Alphaproteobacteria bacterium]
MWTTIRALWDEILTGLWFVPVLFSAAAVGLAAFLPSVPTPSGRLFGGKVTDWFYNGSAAEARDLLDTLLSSLITLTTLAISITMVVLSLAASQLGPRLIRAFMGNRRTQVVLGTFLGAIIYVLLVLRQVDGDMPAEAVPQVAVTFGTASALACLGLLFFFVHHLGRSIVADTVVQRVGDDLDRSIARILPACAPRAETTAPVPAEPGCPLRLPLAGYVQAVDYEALTRCATKADVLIRLDFRPGHHLLADGAHGSVFPAERCDEAVLAAVVAAVRIGSERTPVQDIEFSLRQLVEIALRALSSGINDPNTAVAVIDRLARSLSVVMARAILPEQVRDESGRLRLIRTVSTFEGITDVALSQIRQAGEAKPAILIRQLDCIAALVPMAASAGHRATLEGHATAIVATGRRSIAEPRDLAALEEAYAAIVPREKW